MPSDTPQNQVQLLEHKRDNSRDRNLHLHHVKAENMGFMIRYNTTNNASQVGRQSKSDSPICQPWSLYELPESEYFSCSKWLLFV